ncbi:unnamed protein product, partial [Brassica rapa]
MGSVNSENNYNSDESIGSCEGNSSHTNPTIYFKNLDLKYFYRTSIKGLNHLRQSADGNYDNGTYIYGTLMLCRGNFGEGKKYLDKLSWKTNQVRTAQCLTMVKNSLKKIRAILKTKYLTNTATMEPLTDCHNHDMDSACED